MCFFLSDWVMIENIMEEFVCGVYLVGLLYWLWLDFLLIILFLNFVKWFKIIILLFFIFLWVL